MSADPQDLSQIRHVQVADPVAAEVSSQPTRAIEIRLKDLENAVFNSSTGNNALIIPNVPVKTSGPGAVALYSAVYYNPADGLYELASANVTLVSGSFIANPTSLAVGILVSLNGNIGNVMIGGYMAWTSTIQNALLEGGASSFSPGAIYYLSDTFPGMLTASAPALKVQVLVTSANNFIVAPSYATPESIQNVYVNPVGMRPVGSVRLLQPDYKQAVIVGFDGLEQTSTGMWELTSDGVINNHINFGYMVADASVTIQPAAPVYVSIDVDASGNIYASSADTLAALQLVNAANYLTTTNRNVSAMTALDSGHVATLRVYNVTAPSGQALGTISLWFTNSDTSKIRRVIFKFPDHFQGWKSTNASIPPTATSALVSGAVSSVQVTEGSVGFTLAPTVVFTGGGGTGAAATANINEFGTITGITVTNGGSGYSTAPAVSFTTSVSSVEVLNGGGGGVLTAASVSGGALTGVTITNPGSGYFYDPAVIVVDPLGVGVGSQVTASCINGVINTVTIENGGTGYSSSTPPVLLVQNKFNNNYVAGSSTVGLLTAASTAPTLTPTFNPSCITEVLIQSAGACYTNACTITVTPTNGGSGASLKPIVDDVGRIIAVQIVNPGTGYVGAPTLAVTGVANGNGAILIAVVGCSLNSVAGSGGTGVADPAIAAVGVPLAAASVTQFGQGYTTATSALGVTISAPDLAGGTQAVATAVVGGTVAQVNITNAGTGYSPSLPPALTVGGTLVSGGIAAQFKVAVNAAGNIDNIQIINPGAGYTTPVTLTIDASSGTQATCSIVMAGMGSGQIIGVTVSGAGNGYNPSTPPNVNITASGGGDSTGVGAILQAVISTDGNGTLLGVQVLSPGSGYLQTDKLVVDAPISGTQATAALYLDNYGVTGIKISNYGTGYIKPPVMSITAPPYGTTALASATLLGGTAQLQVAVSGSGGSRMANLQVSNYDADCPGVSRPLNAPFYYNMKADPNTRLDFPAVPIDKYMFMLNGVELRATTYSAATQQVTDATADVAATTKSLLWTTMDSEGCPWDSAFQTYVNDTNATGVDCVIYGTAPSGFTAALWKLWEQVYVYETVRNKGWLHLNKASRFHQTLSLGSLSVMSPLVAYDAVTGVMGTPGTPMTGQVVLGLDSSTVAAGNTGAQINLAVASTIVAIYSNTSARPVAISAITLQTVFQTNQAGATPDNTLAAMVTIGTQAGNYRDIVGTTDSSIASTYLSAVNQVKTLLPDANAAAPVILPGQSVYLQVVQAASAPVSSQVAVANVQGFFL